MEIFLPILVQCHISLPPDVFKEYINVTLDYNGLNFENGQKKHVRNVGE